MLRNVRVLGLGGRLRCWVDIVISREFQEFYDDISNVYIEGVGVGNNWVSRVGSESISTND